MDMDFDDLSTKESSNYNYSENNIHELQEKIKMLQEKILVEEDLSKKEELSCELLELQDKYDELMGISAFKGR